MRVDFLLLADAAKVAPNGKVSILGGAISRITPPSLPFVLPHICAVVRLIVATQDHGTTHEAIFRWLSPSRQEIVPSLRSEFTVGVQEVLSGEDQAITVVAETAPLPLRTEGLHRLEFLLDGSVAGTSAVAVAPQPG